MSRDISKEILKYLNFDKGFYIECGANDGIFMSNTLILEKEKGWTGLLIEPSPRAFSKCKINRPNNTILNYALVSDEYKLPTIRGDFDGHPMSSVGGTRKNNQQWSVIDVPVTTLTEILNEFGFVNEIDFFSLDVEGYELEVLHGLDFSQYQPTYILIEINSNVYGNKVFEFMVGKGYENLGCLSDFNLVDDPAWPKTHQDYLFKYHATS